MITPTTFFAMSELVVMGHNPELADISNPRGEIIGTASFVVAEDAKGYRVRKHVATDRNEFMALAPAETLARALNNRLQKFGKLPVGFASWKEVSPAYGSEAYVESDAEQDLIEWEQSLDDRF